MTDQPKKAKSSLEDALRRRAGDRLKAATAPPGELSAEEARRMIHELQERRIELEIQNEELRSAQAQLVEARTRYVDLYDFAPVGYLGFDEGGLVREANLTISRQLHVERSRLIDSPFVLYVAMEDRQAFRSHLRSVFETRGRQTCELTLRTKAGDDFQVRIVSVYMEDSNGRELCRACLVDACSHKRADDALREKNEILESVFSNIHFLVAYLDTGFNFLRVNDAYAQADKRSPAFFIGRNHFDLYPNEENEAIFRKVLETGEPFFASEKAFEYALRPERGMTYWDWSLHPVKNTDGKVEGLIFCLIDRTDHRRAREALEFERRRLFSLLDELPASIYLQSPDHTIPFANRRFREHFGNPEGRCCYEVLRGYEAPCKDCRTFSVFGTNAPTIWEWTKDPGRTYQIYDYPFSDIDGSPLVLEMLIDISDRKMMEDALRASQRHLRFLSSKLLSFQEEERALVARELHDRVSQTLAAMKYGLEKALRSSGRGKAKTMAESLEPLIPLLQKTMDDIRKLYMGLRPSVLDDFGIVAGVGWLCREFQSLCPGIEIAKQIQAREADVPERLKIVIFRIVQQALDNVAVHSNGHSVELSLRAKGNGIELSVADDGVGFDLNEALCAEDPLRGIGLASMRERTELSGGVFAIESSIGGGTTVRASWAWNA